MKNWCSADERQDMITFLHFRSCATRQFDVCGYPLYSLLQTSDPTSAFFTSVRTRQRQIWPKKMLRQASNTLKRRRLIVTAEGRLGVAVRQARKGDRIAVLQGWSMPIILRPASTSLSPLEGHADVAFMVVGDCYIDGLMHWEAFHNGQNTQDMVLC